MQMAMLAFRNLRVRWIRTLLTMGGIVLGVAVILAIEIANKNILTSIETIFEEASGKAHLVIENTSPTKSGFNEDVLLRVQRVEGVQIAVPTLRARTLLEAEADQWQVELAISGETTVNELFLYGVTPAIDSQVRDYEVVNGRFLAEDDRGYTLVLVEEYAKEHEIKVGEELEILTPGGKETLYVVGLIAKTGPGRLNNGSVGFLLLRVVQEIFERGHEIDQIDVVAAPAVANSPESLDGLKTRLEERLGENFKVMYPVSRGQIVSHSLANYQLGLGFFSAIALFAGAFLVYNAFSMTVLERTREIGLLRSLGFTQGQVAGLILEEAMILGGMGSCLGLLGGLGLARGLIKVMSSVVGVEATDLTVPASGLASSLLVGSLVTLASALLPAYRASRISPLEAIRVRGMPGAGWSMARLLGPALIALALIGLYIPLPLEIAFPIGTRSVFILLLGVTLSLILIVGPLSSLLVSPLSLLYGNEGLLGGGNVQRAKGRTVLTAAALMVSVTMIVGNGAMIDSMRADIHDWVEKAIGGDLQVRSPIPMRTDMATRFEGIEGVEAVAPVQFFSVRCLMPDSSKVTSEQNFSEFSRTEKRDILTFEALELESYTRVASFKFASDGKEDENDAIERLAQGDAVFISTVLSEKYGLQQGDTIRLETRRGQRDFYIAGVIVDFAADGYVINGLWRDARRYFGQNKADVFIIKLTPGASYEAVKAQLENRYGQRCHLHVEASREFKDRILRVANQTFVLFDVLVFISMIVAALGIFNTLLMNILERIREIGGLRSLGMTRGQVARMILAEAGTIGAIGALIGLSVGLFLSKVFVRAANDLSGYALEYVFPTRSLMISVVIALGISQVAALYPAWQASRLNIVEAIQHE